MAHGSRARGRSRAEQGGRKGHEDHDHNDHNDERGERKEQGAVRAFVVADRSHSLASGGSSRTFARRSRSAFMPRSSASFSCSRATRRTNFLVFSLRPRKTFMEPKSIRPRHLFLRDLEFRESRRRVRREVPLSTFVDPCQIPALLSDEIANRGGSRKTTMSFAVPIDGLDLRLGQSHRDVHEHRAARRRLHGA